MLPIALLCIICDEPFLVPTSLCCILGDEATDNSSNGLEVTPLDIGKQPGLTVLLLLAWMSIF